MSHSIVAFGCNKKTSFAHFEPSFSDFAIFNFVNAGNIDLTLSFWKGSRDCFMVDHDIPDNYTG